MTPAPRELFPADRGLVLRMVLAAVATPLLVVAALAAVAAAAPARVGVGVGIATIVGIVAAVRERAAAVRGRELDPEQAPALHAAVERLCVLADLPKPTVMLDSRAMPNSWIEGTKRGGFRLHLTQGLLDLLEPRELEAVIAHELAHVVNRDAAVMTVVGAPGEALLAGGVRVAAQGWFPIMVGGVIASAIGWAGTYGTRALSRYREYAADAGAVALTGSPAALASALMKVSDGLVAMPRRDLREASLHDAFHLLPVSRENAFGLPDTHPPLRARIERLERLERSLHHL
jgi:heat shock protein HtpX